VPMSVDWWCFTAALLLDGKCKFVMEGREDAREEVDVVLRTEPFDTRESTV